MVYGNKAAQSIVQKFFDRITMSGNVSFPFLLLVWPQWIGKTSLAKNAIWALLQEFAAQDFVALYDCSRVLMKPHTLKIEVPTSEQTMEGEDGTPVLNRWVREVISRCTYAPSGQYKVLFLENIERMTVGAANALLKTLEEPLPNRLIVATTSNTELLLQTILSRAFLVHFHPLQQTELRTYAQTTFPDLTPSLLEFALAFSLGSPWTLHRLLRQPEELKELSDTFVTLRSSLLRGDSVGDSYRLLQNIIQKHAVGHVMDALLYSLEPHQQSLQERVVATKRLLTTNVSVDASMFNLALAK